MSKTPEEKISDIEVALENLRKVVVSMHKHMFESFERIDQNFEILRKTATDGFHNVDGQLGEIKTEIQKIQKVSNYPEEYENLLKVSR